VSRSLVTIWIFYEFFSDSMSLFDIDGGRPRSEKFNPKSFFTRNVLLFSIVLYTNRKVLMWWFQWWHYFTLTLKSPFLVEQKPLKKGARRLIFTSSQKIQFLILNDNHYTICRETHVLLISVFKNIKNHYLLFFKVINTKVYPKRWFSINLLFLNLRLTQLHYIKC